MCDDVPFCFRKSGKVQRKMQFIGLKDRQSVIDVMNVLMILGFIISYLAERIIFS